MRMTAWFAAFQSRFTSRLSGSRRSNARRRASQPPCQLEQLEERTFLSAAGSLDAKFGNGGVVLTDLPNGFFRPISILSQSDGKMLSLGFQEVPGFTSSEAQIIRYRMDGSIDETFGNHGIVTSVLPNGTTGLALQSDGKIVIAGGTFGESPLEGVKEQNALARFNVDGSVDPTFGDDGLVTTDHSEFSLRSDYLGVVVQPDGKILAYGNGLTRFNSDGGLDTTFGDGGLVGWNPNLTILSTFNLIQSAVLQSDSKIVVAHFDGLVRYNSDGSLDTTFGEDGRTSFAFDLHDADLTGSTSNLAFQSDGKLVVGVGIYQHGNLIFRDDLRGGADDVGASHFLALCRFNTDGNRDTTFGSDGVVYNRLAGAASSLIIQDDKIVVGGATSTILAVRDGLPVEVSTPSAAFQRFHGDGSLDTTFGLGRSVSPDFELLGLPINFRGMALQTDGRIVVVGDEPSDDLGRTYRPIFARFHTKAVAGELAVHEGRTIGITRTELPSPQFAGSEASMVYRLATIPIHGQLRLNSTGVRVGGSFSQADINAGRLSYRHNGGETGSDRFTYTISGSNRQRLPRQEFFIGVAPVNDPPVLYSISATSAFMENASPLQFTRFARITDPDSSNFAGGLLTVAITANAESADRLTVQPSGTQNGQVSLVNLDPNILNPGTTPLQIVRYTSAGVTRDIGQLFGGEMARWFGISDESGFAIRFSLDATREAVQAVLRQVAFQNTSDDPSPQARTVTITLTDGDGGTSNMTRTQVRMIPVDDRPRLEQFASSINAVVAEPARRLMPQATMLDPDLKRLDGATLVVRGSPTASIIPGDGVWLASATSTIRVDDRIVATVSHSGFQMSVRFNRNATSDDVTRVLRRVAIEAGSTPDRRGTTDVWFTDPNRVRSNIAHLTIQSIARTTATPEEVASRLHSQQITGVTVVTHGFQPTEDGDALHPLARAIWEREDATNGDDAAWFLDEDVNGPNGQYVFDTSPFDGQPVLPPIGTTSQRGEVVLLFDWAADSNEPGSGYGEAIGQRLFQVLVDLGLVDPAQGAANTIPLHFIGHSFGAAVTSEAIERLAYYGVPVDQVTYLDPHDFNQGLGFDGSQQLFTLGQPQFSDGSQGYGATVWNNVAFADVYYQTEGSGLIPNGRPILGAYNTLMNHRVSSSNPHSRIWDDFYLSTVIDVYELSSDTTNFGGYAFSRIAAGESPRPAPRFFDASQSHVYTSRHLVAFTASGSPIREADHSFRRGDQAPSDSIKYAPLWQPA